MDAKKYDGRANIKPIKLKKEPISTLEKMCRLLHGGLPSG